MTIFSNRRSNFILLILIFLYYSSSTIYLYSYNHPLSNINILLQSIMSLPMYLTSQPFQRIEVKNKITNNVNKFFYKYNYKVHSTKKQLINISNQLNILQTYCIHFVFLPQSTLQKLNIIRTTLYLDQEYLSNIIFHYLATFIMEPYPP